MTMAGIKRLLEESHKFTDGEVLGEDADGNLVCWNLAEQATYNCGQTLAEYGAENLTEIELGRVLSDRSKG